MRFSYCHASICANFSFNFLKKVVRDQRWSTAPWFVVNISPSFGEFTAPLRHIWPIYNVTLNSNYLFVNFSWTFTFCVDKSYDGTHIAFGGTWDRHCHFKHVSLKASSTTVKRARLTGKRSRSTAVFHNKHNILTFRTRLAKRKALPILTRPWPVSTGWFQTIKNCVLPWR
jgi:hypothetical protein